MGIKRGLDRLAFFLQRARKARPAWLAGIYQAEGWNSVTNSEQGKALKYSFRTGGSYESITLHFFKQGEK
jgi:hypothetical protein